MKQLFYFLFGFLTMLVAVLFGLEQCGREVIQDYWIERIWYGDLSQYYTISKCIILAMYFIFIVIWTYKQGMNAAHEISEKESIIKEEEK